MNPRDTAIAYSVEPGENHPLGATPDRDGVNFALFTEHATSVQLLLFAKHNDLKPIQTIPLDPLVNRTFVIWHIYVRGLRPGVFYAYRVDGPRDPTAGDRFDVQKALIDPYSRGMSKSLWNRGAACVPGDNLATSLRSGIRDVQDD